MPDDELFREAREGTLRANLRRQVVRMLEDPRSDALRGELRRPVAAAPQAGRGDPGREPLPRLRRRACGTRCAGRRSGTSRTSSGRTAACWSCSTPTTPSSTRRWRAITASRASRATSSGKVPLADRRRGGVLTQASVLTLTSNPNRTSPVKRGQWILQQLLGTPPPPPPPDVAEAGREQGGRRRRLPARADGGAPDQPAVRVVPPADGPPGLRPGELRRRRALADHGRRVPHRPLRRADRGAASSPTCPS